MAENLMQLSRMYSEYTDSQIQLHCTVLPDARHIHLCFQARKSNESHLAPYPGLKTLLIG